MNSVNQIVAEIKTFLDSKQEEALSYLKLLVKTESPTGSKPAIDKIMELLRQELETLDYYTFRNPGNKSGGYLFARPKQRKKNIPIQLLIGHCDTVWGLNTIKSMPMTDTREKLSGPGVYDMKAGLTQIIFAIKALHHLKLAPSVTPVILINSDEETGSKESTSIIKKLAIIADRAYILEPPLGLQGKLKTARKGIGRFTITVKGKAAHAGLEPEKGVNAIVELSHQIQKLYAMNDAEKGITVNVGTITGGISPNVVAPESTAVIDVRVLNQKDGKFISDKIHSLKPTIPDTTLEIHGKIGRQPMEKTKRNETLWNLALSKAKLMNMNLKDATAGGGSDGNTTSLHTATLDGLGTTGDGAHAQHEFILKEKMMERTLLLTLLILDKPLNLKPLQR
ncbi:glutamate carboxypeptidase [Zhouia amylolytica]|uniref:Glutamate carboxypeptidase n=1 Tax=Zhouia amylolytica TaxID=376730 RepID=A0A1I6T121_9FLAO|nr:M20 family metallopeptidase [Zhouia amylolytica]SFS82939.1 glutamate carboxypeptidase [Zhouia amylolytica]